MALQKQVVALDFTKGVDKKRDSRLMVPGELTRLENAAFDTTNVVKKRAGAAALTMTGASGEARKLMLHGEQLLERGTSGALTTYSETSQKWYSVNSAVSPYTIHSSLRHAESLRTPDDMKDVDHAILNGVCVVAWRTSGSGVRASVFDVASGARYVSDATLHASGLFPRVVALPDSNRIMVLYVEGTNVRAAYINTSAPNSFTLVLAATDYGGGIGSGAGFDAVEDSGNVFMAYSTGADLRWRRLDSSASSVGANLVSGIQATYLTVAIFSNGYRAMFYRNAGNDMAVTVLDAGFVPTTTVIEAGVSPELSFAHASATDLVVYYTLSANTSSQHIRSSVVTPAGVASSPATLMRGMRVVSRATTTASLPGLYLFVVSNYSTLQPTAFLATSGGRITGRALTWTLGDLDYPRVTSLHFTTQSELSVCLPHRSPLLYAGGGDVSVNGVTRCLFEFEAVRPIQSLELGGLTYLLSAAPVIFDGASAVEAGFHYYPEAPTAVDNGAGNLSAGVYQFVTVYEWRDSKGNRHRSVTSVPGSVTLAATRQARLTLPTLRQTSKTFPRGEVQIVVYRTEADGSIYYRSGGVTNTTAANTVLYDDNTSDASLISSEILYTVSGELDDESMPPCRVGCVHQNRLFVAGLENPYEVRYSKEWVTGFVPGFSEDLVLAVPPTKGEVTALASMDDKLFVFCERGVFYFSGVGPNALGQQNGYSEAQVVSEDVGCKLASPSSVVVMPMGVMFHSEQGVRLLDRGHNIARGPGGAFVGSEVDTLATACVAAILLPSKHQVRFYTGTTALVFDYLWQQWSVFTNQTALDAVVWNNTAVVLRGVNTVWQEGGTTDAGTNIAMALETGWLHFAGAQGFQRVYRLLFLASFDTSGSVLSFEYGFDYEAAYATAVTIDAAATFSTSVPVQVRHHLPRQKCSAVRFRITETSGAGAGMSWANLALEVGAKSGGFKLPAGKTI